ncbi:ATP-binding protein [Corynebacterium glyciniphilum]|uniref:ATP-binding protein n=1 Tax=Corynebacterium glyciniphilum TaxID=1404244 RepID=UPI0026541F50|nr:ATP-binding protein [Corynebacterium glyciniphilum]MDN5684628.1 ATP-binding protein [Corynebacterium glyciniphilum]MDN6705866.1 ATP-binding protein [Corynebacterium glyciniphilum]
MARIRNPFRASIGASPPVLVGRDSDIEDFDSALDDGPGTLERITLFTGVRGVGKTCMLNAVEDVARSRGWHVFAESADQGFMDNLVRQVARAVEELGDDTVRRRISGGTLGRIGVSTMSTETADWSSNLRELLGTLDGLHSRFAGDDEPAGTLITLDEVHVKNRNELREFATVIQHLVRADANIAVAMAGIPSAVERFISDKDNESTITFIRRADRVFLGSVSDDDVREALSAPVEPLEVTWDEAALETATEACGGYPFMIQLVGHYSFRAAEGDTITLESVSQGVGKARRKLGTLVHDPALKDLSGIDKTVLVAMSVDDGPSRPADLAERINQGLNYLYVYRARLTNAGMIQVLPDGRFDLAVPYLREYLREHAATLGLSLPTPSPE